MDTINLNEFLADTESSQTANVHYGILISDGKVDKDKIIMLFLGSSEEFCKIYSLPTRKYDNIDSQFGRCPVWLKYRN